MDEVRVRVDGHDVAGDEVLHDLAPTEQQPVRDGEVIGTGVVEWVVRQPTRCPHCGGVLPV